MYILVKIYKNWMDVIMTTNFKILKCSKDRNKLVEWSDNNIDTYRSEDDANTWEIYKVDEL